MEMKTIKVSEKGQIAIPIQVRERMKIEQGDELILFESGGRILLKKTDKLVERVDDDFKDVIKLSEDSLKDVWDNEEDDIWNRYIEK